MPHSRDSGKPARVTEAAQGNWLKRLWNSWATRSLAVGAVATCLDLLVGWAMLSMGFETRMAAMTGVSVGATFAFLANRYFAFREHDAKLASPLFRYVLTTALAMVVHGQVVVILRDRFGVPFMFSKLGADLMVFTFGQLLLLRYVVFPKPKLLPDPEPEAVAGEP